MAAKCVSLIKACRLRLVKLDVCGAPVVGAKSVLVSDGFIRVQAKAVIETGQEFKQKNACGEYCINETDCDLLTRYDLSVDYCNIDPDAVSMTTSQRLISAAGTSIGFASGETVDCDAGYSMELWQKPSGANACDTGVQEWMYWAFPWIDSGTIGDLTFENGPFTFTVNSKTKGVKAAGQWGANNLGPFGVIPTGEGFQVGEHVMGFLTDVQPPDAVCGAIAYAAPTT